ncbi:MAG: RND family transporter [Bacteroidales bacterium]|nr:RND family transporter [Bacteroidales bacterium]
MTEAIIKFKWIIVVVVIALTVFLGYQIKNLQINSDVIDSLPDDDPDAVLFKRIGEEFGGNNMGIVILETDNIYKTEVLRHISQITDTIKNIEGISSVTSLTNIIDIKGGDFGIEIGKLVDEYDFPETVEQLQMLMERVNSKDLYSGSIVSKDGTATLVIFTLENYSTVKTIAEEVKQKVLALDLPENIYFTGSPMLVTYISDLIRTDLIRLIPIAFLLIAFILFLSFRSIQGVVLPLLTTTIAIIWTIGIMVLIGFQMSMISNNIPIILLAVGTAYTIHVINRINQLKETNMDRAIKMALKYITIPVILAALTTVVGFISFIFGAYLKMIRDFGIFTAMGTFFAMLLSLVFVPAIISMISKPRKSKNDIEVRVRKSYLSSNFLTPLKILLFKHPKYILISWTVLLLISVFGIFLIKRSVNIQEYFKKGNPTRLAEQIMEQKFSGTKPIFVLFQGDMQSPEVLKMMIKTEEYMKQSPDIKNTQSVADLIVEISDVLGEGRKIPDEKDQIEQLWFLIDGNETLQRFVSDDLEQGIILSNFVSPENSAKKAFASYMRKFIDENSSPECKIQITGMPFVDITMDRSLINSQMGSLSIAIVFVLIIVALILKSFPSGVYATIPIIAAIVILFGFMGFAGIPLNIATVLVASVALGIGIDYSIHIISHFNHSYARSQDVVVALEETIMISGKAIVINVISVSAGFLVLIFSQMVPLQYFGMLIALSMLGSSQGALTLLPVILILVYRRKKR